MEKRVEKQKRIDLEVVTQMITLSTSGFGLVAALAWNNVVQELVNNYIKKWFPDQSGIFSLLLYAILVTFLAVFITLQFSRLKDRLENN